MGPVARYFHRWIQHGTARLWPFAEPVFRLSGMLATVGRWLRAHLRQEPLPRRPLVVVAACLAAGCAASRALPLPADMSGAAPLWMAAVVAIAVWWHAARRARPTVATVCLGVAITCTGASWAACRFDLFPADDLAWQLGEAPVPVAVTGVVVEAPRRLPPPSQDPARAAAIGPSSELRLDVTTMRSGSRWRRASGRASVIVEGEPPGVEVGSRIRVLGRGLRPSPALNPGEFDFRLRARSQRCLSIIRVHDSSCIRTLQAPTLLSPGRSLERVRRWASAVLVRSVSPTRAPLASALLLGTRESLPRDDVDDYLVTGTVHILSISGLHVGLLALALFAALRMLALPRAWSLTMVVVCTAAYAMLVRAETPVVRATLVVWLACLATATGRRSPAINALAAAAVVVLAWRPVEVFSVGTQLSFLSTAVLVGGSALVPAATRPSDPIDRLIERSRSRAERLLRSAGWQAWRLFAIGAVVWLATAPIVAARFHVVSPVGLVVNVLIAPVVALAMASGFLCLVTAPLSDWLAATCGGACDGALALLSWLVAWSAAVPLGHGWVRGPAAWWVIGWYTILAGAVVLLPKERLGRGTTWAVLVAGWLFVGGCAEAVTGLAAGGGLRVIAAAVGHGCGIVVRSPGGRCLVYDAGRLGAPGAARRAIAGVIWSEGITRIDALVVSHADADHFNAVPELLGRFTIGELVVSEAFLASKAPGVTDLLERVDERRIPVRVVGAGTSFALDPTCRVRVLHPGPVDPSRDRQPADSDNEQSLVMAVEAAGRRLLLTGDLEGETLAAFVASGPDACDVLVAPHHGTRTSLPADIASATMPEVVLISGVGGTAWPEVRAAYRDAAARGGRAPPGVLKTGGEGALAVDCTAGWITISRFAAGRWMPSAATSGEPAVVGATIVTRSPAGSPAARLRSGESGWPRSRRGA